MASWTVDLTVPEAMGGSGGTGTNPEQLFAAAYAACFQSSLGVVARRAGRTVEDSTVTAQVGIGPAADGAYGITVELKVHLPSVPDQAEAEDLVSRAHEVCPYSRAIRGTVPVTETVNG